MEYIVWHGTNFEFDIFSSIPQNDNFGFFFSEDEDDARGYGVRVLKCRIKLSNPYRVKSSEIYIGVNEVEEHKSPWCIGQDLLKMEGFDGCIISGSEEEHEKTGEYESLYTQYICFDPSQIEILT